MNKTAILFAAVGLLMVSLACTVTDRLQDVDVDVPRIETGEVREEHHRVVAATDESMDVDIVFGAGRLEIESGASDALLTGSFEYNVEEWAPEVSQEGSQLTIRQGGDRETWGIPSGNVRNHWTLAFSPQTALKMNVRAGAADGKLDFTGLQISELDVDLGAGTFTLLFDAPNPVPMDHLTLDTGASKIQVEGVGNASPGTVRVQGGVGDISLDLTGNWTRSADVTIRAGVGALRVTLPSDVGVEIKTTSGLTNIEAYGLRQMGGTYTNDAFGETDVELRVSVMTALGNVRLIEEGAEE